MVKQFKIFFGEEFNSEINIFCEIIQLVDIREGLNIFHGGSNKELSQYLKMNTN